MERLLHDPRVSTYWTSEEQSVLKYLLEKYNTETSIVRYANIAQALTEKSIRDVVLRCRWMRANKKGGDGRHLVDRTTRVLDQLSANISEEKIDGNIDLLCEARDNILAMLNGLPEMDMPFPFRLNQELVDSILPPP